MLFCGQIGVHQLWAAHQLNTDVFRGGVRDAELAGNDDCGEGERAAHVDGAVVGGHGEGALLGEELGNEGEADGVLRGLRRCKADAQHQQLPEAGHLHMRNPHQFMDAVPLILEAKVQPVPPCQS